MKLAGKKRKPRSHSSIGWESFRPPPLPEAEAHDRARARVERMSPEEALETFVKSGIVAKSGKLTKNYRELK